MKVKHLEHKNLKDRMIWNFDLVELKNEEAKSFHFPQ